MTLDMEVVMLDNLFYRFSPSPNKTALLHEACLNECNLNGSSGSQDHLRNDSVLVCLHCNLSFFNKRELDEHLMCKHGGVKMEMVVSTTNYDNDTNEINSNTASADKFQCLNCKTYLFMQSNTHKGTALKIMTDKLECECGQLLNTDNAQRSIKSTECTRCNRCSISSGNDSKLLSCECNCQLPKADNSLGRTDILNKDNNPVYKRRTGLFVCSICGRKFRRKTFLFEHCRKLHNTDKEYIKSYCESKSRKGRAMEKNVPCSYCNKRYVRKSDLVRHQLKKHLDESKKANIVRTIDHMDAEVLKSAEMEVDGSIIYHCKLCKKNIVTKRSYVRHVRIHTGERPFTCHICGKQYRSSADLTRHLRSVHDGIKNYSCDICGRCFANKSTRNDHRRIHTGERPYICDICGKAFPTANSIYVHRRIHTDYFPYQCTSCEKRFRRRQQLIHHIRTHTGEKPHACDICGKCFGVKDELSRHLRTHSLDKPFACSECGLCFGQKRYLNKHIRTQHSVAIDVMS